MTRIGVRADEVLKGSVAGQLVSVHQLGGKVGDIASFVGGAPRFTVGERVLLFLSRRRGGELRVTGLFQGKFSLEQDPSSGREIAVRRIPGTAQPLDEIPLDKAKQLVLGNIARVMRGEEPWERVPGA
ncbi:MAG: hypothetical protein ACE5JD_11590 [Candidatus Methylomirabilia bacterium]